ncbi:MAG TPA: hypothetical protein PK711_07970 [Bacteroidales bacterium]|nr:hypothetical protein [Bacteroidales bacterium]
MGEFHQDFWMADPGLRRENSTRTSGWLIPAYAGMTIAFSGRDRGLKSACTFQPPVLIPCG